MDQGLAACPHSSGSQPAQLCVCVVPSLKTSCGPRCTVFAQVVSILEQADTSFKFDAFALQEATEGHPLSVLGFFLLHRSGLMSTFKIKVMSPCF